MTSTTITRAEIKQLRDEALDVGDSIMADLANIVLAGEDSDGTGTTLGKPCTLAQATERVAMVILFHRTEAAS